MKQFIYILLIAVFCLVACNKKDDDRMAHVATLGVTGITDTEAVCWGKFIDRGSKGIKEYGIKVNATSEVREIIHTIAGTDSFAVELTGLNKGEKYSYEAYCIEEGGGLKYGKTVTFITLKPASFNVTVPLQNISATSATAIFSGTEMLKEWGGYYSTGNVTTSDPLLKSSTGKEIELTNLRPNTSYSILPYAIDKNNLTSYIGLRSFTTKCAVPELRIIEATGVTPNQGKVIFEVTDTGGGEITACVINYSADEGLTWKQLKADYTTGHIEKSIVNLQPATSYQLYVSVSNKDEEAISDTITFTTTGGIPTLAKPEVDALKSYKINMINGKVSSENMLPVSEYGFCWSTTSGQAVAEGANFTKVSTGTKDAFAYTSHDLLANTKYYVRAYAKNAVGTGYSAEVQVSTPAIVYGEVNDRYTVGKKYKTVVIGTQTWMAENLISGDGEAFNVTKIKNLATDMCPSGWHIPTQAEFKELITEAGGTNLATKTLRVKNEVYGLGTNATGFSVIPESNLGQSFNNNAYWTSTQAIDVGSGSTGYYHIFMSSNGYDQLGYVSSDSHKFGDNYNYPIRCIKNK